MKEDRIRKLVSGDPLIKKRKVEMK